MGRLQRTYEVRNGFGHLLTKHRMPARAVKSAQKERELSRTDPCIVCSDARVRLDWRLDGRWWLMDLQSGKVLEQGP